MNSSKYDSLLLIGKFSERNTMLVEEIESRLGINSSIRFLGKCRSESGLVLSNESRYIMLIDALELSYSTLESYLSLILSKTRLCSIIVFNVPKNSELESIVRWPRVEAIVFKGKKDKKIISSVGRIMKGRVQIPEPIVFTHFLQARTTPGLQDTRHHFTKRELQILLQISQGLSNKVIAHTLGVSSHTIKTHIYNLFKKINVTNRVQAIVWAKQHYYI